MKKNLRYFIGLFSVIVVITVVLAACAFFKKKEITKPEPDTEASVPQVTQQPEIETHEGQAKSYLTGQWIDQNLAAQRPVAIMIENTSATLPQYNISKADIIYESAVEGGITRLMGIYQDYSNMDRIGNVRSCRIYYVYFAKEFDAMYVHAGESSYATPVLESGFIDHIDGIKALGNTCFYRTNDRKSPHNLYTSSEGIANAIQVSGFDTELPSDYKGHYLFAEDQKTVNLEAGQNAAVVALYYVNPKPWFEYNETDGLYYRYEFGEAQMDAVNNEQLAVKNIILQNCNSRLFDSDSGSLNIDYMSGGSGTYITNGKAIDITWTRESESSPTKYYDSTGKEITLNQGKTWVCIIQNESANRNTIYGTKEEFQASK